MIDRALCDCIPGHRVGWLTGVCIDCGFTEADFLDQGNRPCVGLQRSAHRRNDQGRAENRNPPGPLALVPGAPVSELTSPTESRKP